MNNTDMHNHKGFSLVEMMIVVLILSVIFGGVFFSMSAGQDTWLTTDSRIRLQENIRQALGRISREVRESGRDSGGILQVMINDGGGLSGSDILQFRIPAICETGNAVIDANGDVANWGAALTWGCNSTCDPDDGANGCALTCTDADDDCGTVDYDMIEYRMDANGQLVRRVLDNASAVVRSDVMAQNVTDLQVSTPSADVVRIAVTVTSSSNLNRQLSDTNSVDILLRNS